MDNLFVALVSTIVFVGLMLGGSFLYWSVKSREEAAAKELARRLGTLAEKSEDRLFRIQAQDASAEALGGLGESLDAIIRQSGEDTTVSELLTRVAVFGLAGMVVLGFLTRSVVGVAGLFIGFVPILLLVSKANARANKLSEQLPDALDLVGRSLQAGHGFSDALRMCAEEMAMPIAQEFGRVYEEHNLGRDFRECLNGLVRRNPSNFDLKIFVSAVLLQRDTGGNLIEILDNIAKTVRDRFVFSAKVKAITAEARISAVILGSMPVLVTLALTVIRPEYLQPLVNDPIGNVFAGGAIGMFGLGVFVMYQLSKVEI